MKIVEKTRTIKNITMPILDKGEIEVVDYFDQLSVVNSARVSFGKRKERLDEKDVKLMNYLATNKHYSPFRHLVIQFRIKAPEFVMRQIWKHVVGIETSSTYPTKDNHAWNEISMRYVPIGEFYDPPEWRRQSENNKQGSAGPMELKDQNEINMHYQNTIHYMNNAYNKLLDLGVAKEQARILLPLSVYSECWWTAGFQAIMNFIELRKASDSQLEIREYAEAMEKIIKEIVPDAINSWQEVHKK